jgi:hypothetical protein
LVRKLKKEENLKEKQFTKKEGFRFIIPKKVLIPSFPLHLITTNKKKNLIN